MTRAAGPIETIDAKYHTNRDNTREPRFKQAFGSMLRDVSPLRSWYLAPVRITVAVHSGLWLHVDDREGRVIHTELLRLSYGLEIRERRE